MTSGCSARAFATRKMAWACGWAHHDPRTGAPATRPATLGNAASETRRAPAVFNTSSAFRNAADSSCLTGLGYSGARGPEADASRRMLRRAARHNILQPSVMRPTGRPEGQALLRFPSQRAAEERRHIEVALRQVAPDRPGCNLERKSFLLEHHRLHALLGGTDRRRDRRPG